MGSNYVAVTSYIVPILSKEFLGIQAIIECGFTPKRVREMIITCRPKKISSRVVASYLNNGAGI